MFQFHPCNKLKTMKNNPKNNQHQLQFELQAMDNIPADDILLNFMSQFDPVTENLSPNLPLVAAPQNIAQPQPQPQPLQPKNTMNISNISNVQNNVNANKPALPNMYFGGHGSIVINYNFGPPK